MSSIHTVIQHHPSRAAVLPDLIAALGDLDPQVITDPGHDQTWSAWRSFRACLQACPANSGHLLVIQDDAVPCLGFDTAARSALAVKPDRIVCFYVGGGRVGEPLVKAAVSCASWAALDQNLWVPLVATAFPRAIVAELLEWAESDSFAQKSRGDDAVLGKFMRAKGHIAWATIPNLVQHPDVLPSLIRRTAAAGRDRNRVAVCWVGEEDVSQIVW